MKGENRLNIKIRLLYILIVFAAVFSLNTIKASAYGECGGHAGTTRDNCGCFDTSCDAHTAKSCGVGIQCWLTSLTSKCDGHAFGPSDITYSDTEETGSAIATCTTGADYQIIVYGTPSAYCSRCGYAHTGNRTVISQESGYAPATGHTFSGYQYSAESHWRICTDPHGHYGSDRFPDSAGTYSSETGTSPHTFTDDDWVYNEDGTHYRICPTCGYTENGTYNFTINFNPNGGALIGSPSKTMFGGSNMYNLGTYAFRTGYEFMGWGNLPDWCETRYDPFNDYKQAYQWAQICGTSIQYYDNYGTLYAQWERNIKFTFYYWGGSGGTYTDVIFTWHNAESQAQTKNIPGLGNAVRLGQTWTYYGYDLSNSSYRTDGNCTIPASQTTITANVTDSDRNYYAKYHTTVTMTYVDYGTDKQITRTDSKEAYMNWDYSSHTEPSFTTPTENTMKYTEASARCKHSDNNSLSTYTRCELCKQETWSSSGWAFENTSSTANINYAQGATIVGNSSGHNNVNRILYGRYSKIVRLTFNSNGGTACSTITYTRQANAYDVSAATVQAYTLPASTYVASSGVTKYNFGAWTGTLVSPDNDFNVSTSAAAYTNIVGSNITANVLNGESFQFVPRVSDTIYASWTNQTAQTSIEPKVTVKKTAVWKTPTSDNSAVDFDNLQNIDIDGKVVVTLDITVENANGYQLTNLSISDFINTDMWIYSYVTSQSSNVNAMTYTNGGLYLTLSDPSAASTTYKATYELQLKEKYWDVTEDTNLYINKIPDLTKYLASVNTDGTLDYSNMYYCESKDAEKSYVKASYTIYNGSIRGTQRIVHYATPYVVMRQVNWIPTVSLNYGIGIESDTNNIYRDMSSDYQNTYFVKYDTKSSDSSNSTFRLFELSQIRRSYSTYQITDNLMDMRTAAKNQEVIDNFLAINSTRGSAWSDTTAAKLSSGFKIGELLKVVKADNIRSSVTTNGVIYKTAALTSYDTVYATNQDGLKISIYPFIRTTNSKTGKTYETTRDTNTLKNKRIDLVIDASDPIITPPSSGSDSMRTEDEDGNKWTESDGYMDINLVDKATNPSPATKTLTFKFEDEVSGVNSPYADNSDWIDTSSKNVQITLERVDNDPIMIFDSGVVPTNQSNVVKVTYDSTNTMNKTGNIKVILDPENKDILGHLRLTIKVIDNVSNYTVKTYDIYVFCLTGAVEIADTLPDYNTRLLELNRFANGELGSVNVSAGGYVDRVTVDFDAYLEKLYGIELGTRKNFISDTAVSINGDYPYTDARNTGTSEDGSMTYLPYSMQVNTWGYTDDTLGGLKVKEVALNKYVSNVDNSILQKHLTDLIERYQGMNQGASYDVEKGSDYAIVGSTLYTYPIMNGDSITSYADKYELGGETYYDDVLYPAYVTLDGTKGITIIYDSVAPDVSKSDENELRRKIVASVEDTTQIILSNWVQVGEGYLRPFMHYFYMPLDAEEKTASDPYYVTLTSYKDSEKEFVHSVTIRLSFYNDIEAIHKKLETYIKDN